MMMNNAYLTLAQKRATARSLMTAMAVTELARPSVESILIHSSTVDSMTAAISQLKNNQPQFFEARKKK